MITANPKTYQIVDLTHPLAKNVPSWDGGCGFQNVVTSDYSDSTSDVKFRLQEIKMAAGIGTHLDAPAHCVPNGITVDRLPLKNLIAPCVVIDLSKEAHERYSVSVRDIEIFEGIYGKIPPGCFVMIRTGWELFWNDPDKYLNNHRFPSLSRQAAEFLIERGIVGLGIDTLSPDRPEDGYPVHEVLLGAGKYIVENAANLNALPPTGSTILALPIKVKGGTEAPIRLIALL